MDYKQAYENVTANSYSNSEGVLQIRLNTDKIIDGFEFWLRGARQVSSYNENTGKTNVQTVTYGRQKANELGVQSLVSSLSMIINSQTVQGNFESYDDYMTYTKQIHEDFNDEIIKNCDDWEILDEDLELIVKQIMALIVPFMSRLIKNKERDSYGETMKTVETNNSNSKNPMAMFQQ